VAGGAAELTSVAVTCWTLAGVAMAYGASWLWWTSDLRRSPTDPLAFVPPPDAG
jgi:hypothetical protein